MRWFFSLLLITFLLPKCIGQGWQPIGLTNIPGRFDDVFFIDEMRGWTGNGSGAIYRTINGGQDWDQVFDGFPLAIRSLTFLDEDTGFAGSLYGELLRTTDGGNTWEEIQHLVPGAMNGICGLDNVGNHVFAVGVWATPAFFIHSSDRGESWTYTDMTSLADGLVECRFITDKKGWLGGILENEGGVVLKTEDGGQTWKTVHITKDPFEYVWKIDIVNDSILYASIESFSDSTSILKSTDGGENWFELPVSPRGLDVQGIGFRNPLHGWVGPRSEPLFETVDGGQTWTQMNIMPGINRFFRLDENLMYASGHPGIFRYDNATTPVTNIQSKNSFHAITEISPNPGRNNLRITFRLDMKSRIRLDLFSQDLRKVISISEEDLPAGTYTRSIPPDIMARISPGAWLITLRTNEGFLSEKWIKQD